MISHGKVGTIPETVQLRYRYKLRAGLVIRYRPLNMGFHSHKWAWEPRERQWSTGVVDRINEDGYVFISRM